MHELELASFAHVTFQIAYHSVDKGTFTGTTRIAAVNDKFAITVPDIANTSLPAGIGVSIDVDKGVITLAHPPAASTPPTARAKKRGRPSKQNRTPVVAAASTFDQPSDAMRVELVGGGAFLEALQNMVDVISSLRDEIRSNSLI